jgi:hypothetical protein
MEMIMRLIDFRTNDIFTQLFRRMGTKYQNIDLTGEWENFDRMKLQEALKIKGKEIELSELEKGWNEPFEFNGQKVLVYIRDQYYSKYEYKYHLCNCKKIEEMRNNNRGERYIATKNTSGEFLINIKDHSGNYLEKEVKRK